MSARFQAIDIEVSSSLEKALIANEQAGKVEEEPAPVIVIVKPKNKGKGKGKGKGVVVPLNKDKHDPRSKSVR